MDDIKKAQLTNLRVWHRRFSGGFDVYFNEEQAILAIEAANKYPALSGSVRRLPLALIFNVKIGQYDQEINTEFKQFLASVFATVMVAKVYDGDTTPWGDAVKTELNRRYGRGAEMSSEAIRFIKTLTAVAEEWYKEASAVREKEHQTLGGMLSKALRNPQMMEQPTKGNTMEPIIHVTEVNGKQVKITSLSPHPFKLSNGDTLPAQSKEVVDFFTLTRKTTSVYVHRIAQLGMEVNTITMALTEGQGAALEKLALAADIVIIPFPMLTALREQGIRHLYQNCVAFNATQETQRSAPNDKVVDLMNWSY